MIRDVDNRTGDLWSYLDDGNVFIHSNLEKETVQSLEVFFQDNPDGLSMNINKTQVINKDVMKYNGNKILGSYIGSRNYRRRMVLDELEIFKWKIKQLQGISSQSGLIILRNCIIPSMNHLLRTCFTDDIADVFEEFDETVRNMVRRIMGIDVSNSPKFFNELISLPFKQGGIGLTSLQLIRGAAYEASLQSSKKIVLDILGYKQDEEEEMQDQKERVKILMKELEDKVTNNINPILKYQNEESKSRGAFAYLAVAPLDASNFRLTDQEILVGLRARLYLNIFNNISCSRCNKDVVAGHDLVCEGNNLMRVKRHEVIKKLLAKYLKINHSIVKEEVMISPNLRMDLVVEGPSAIHGKDLIDISIVSSYIREEESNNENNLMDKLNERHEEKILKYSNGSNNVVPFIVSSGGMLHGTAGKILKNLKKNGGEPGKFLIELSLYLIRLRTNYGFTLGC